MWNSKGISRLGQVVWSGHFSLPRGWHIKLKEGLKQMSNNIACPDVVVLGEVMVEMAPLGKECFQMGVAGDTFNTSAALAQLGVSVSYLTMLGQDNYSQRIVERLTELGIDERWVLRDATRQPGLYLIDNTADGERYFTYWRGQSAAKALFGSVERLREVLPQLSSVPHIYLSGITLALCSEESLDYLFEFFESYSGRLYYDCNYRPALWESAEQAGRVNSRMLGLCHVYLPGLEDEQAISGLVSQDAVWEKLRTDQELEVVMTAGAEGISVLSDASLSHWQQPLVEGVVDTTGAGDSFNGAYIAARIKGLPAMPAAQFACSAAARVITERGAILPTEKWLPLKQQLNRLQSQPGDE